MLHYALAGFFTFLYCRQIGLRVFPSLVAGTVFSLLGYLPQHLIHPSIIASGAWIPLLLYFFERLRKKPNIKDVMYASFIVALQVFAGHPQFCFYTYMLLTFYVIFHLFHQEPSSRLRFALFSILSLVLGLLLALPQIVAIQELTAMAARAKTTYEFFSSFALQPHRIMNFLFPFFYYYGGYSGEYWGTWPEDVEVFVGTMPFLLAILVMTRWKKDPHIFFWGIVAVIAVVLALGDAVQPLNKLLFHLPGYNSFRGPSKHIIEMSFALSVLTGFGISYLQERERDKRFHFELMLVISAVIVISIITFTFFDSALRTFFETRLPTMQNIMIPWEHRSIPEKAISITNPSLHVPIIIMFVCLMCVLVSLKVQKRYLRDIVLSVIFIVIFAEAILFKQNMGPMPSADYVENHNKAIYDIILSAGNNGRTIFFSYKTLPLTAITHGIRLAEGYDPLQIKDYSKLLPTMMTQPPRVSRAYIANNSLLSMMSVRYLVVEDILGTLGDIRWYIARDWEGKPLPIPPGVEMTAKAEFVPIYRKLASFPENSVSLYENLIAQPRAYSVSSLQSSNSTDELIKMLFSYQLDPWHQAALSAEDLREIGTDNFSSGDVSIVEDRPDKVTITARFPAKGFVVLADQFYPGWKAYIDGRQTRIYKTNGVQRGVAVPEGEHVLVFKYVPRQIYASFILSSILLVLTLLFLFKLKRNTQRS